MKSCPPSLVTPFSSHFLRSAFIVVVLVVGGGGGGGDGEMDRNARGTGRLFPPSFRPQGGAWETTNGGRREEGLGMMPHPM